MIAVVSTVSTSAILLPLAPPDWSIELSPSVPEIFPLLSGLGVTLIIGLGTKPLLARVNKEFSQPGDPSARSPGDPGTLGLSWPAWLLGFLEQILFFAAILNSAYVLIAGWLAFKLGSKWQAWQHLIKVPPDTNHTTTQLTQADRNIWGTRVLSRFLVGTLYNLLAAFAGTLVAASWTVVSTAEQLDGNNASISAQPDHTLLSFGESQMTTSLVIGFAFAVVASLPIKQLTNLMRRGTPIRDRGWQTMFLGTIEQLLFVTSLIIQPAFIAVWLGIKTAGEWTGWNKEEKSGFHDKALVPYLAGTGISVLCAGIGFGITVWRPAGNPMWWQVPLCYLAFLAVMFCWAALCTSNTTSADH